MRGVPPLLDRFAGFEGQLDLTGRYRLAVVEHFWCAPYAGALRPYCDRLVLDLHNIESELARTHASATGGLEAIAHRRFAASYRRLEREWIPQFDVILTTSRADAERVAHRNVVVYPNALPAIATPLLREENCLVFSGNLEYHPNVEAVRWFATAIWPKLRDGNKGLTWRLVGRNAEAIRGIAGNDPRIEITGGVDSAVAEIAKARVVVVPLLSGSGTRFKILEAWAARRAVVSTDIGAEGLEARDGKHLSIADDPQAFAAAVQNLIANPARASQLGAAGHALYLEKYTWPAAWQSLASCF